MSGKENSKKKLEQIAINLLQKNKSYKDTLYENLILLKNLKIFQT